MSEGRERQAGDQGTARGPGARAGATIDRWGAQLGLLALGAGSQLRELAARAGTSAGDNPPAGAGDDLPSPPPPVARADAALDRAGERIGGTLALAGRQIQRAVARGREEAEDMWAEAQAVRRRSRA